MITPIPTQKTNLKTGEPISTNGSPRSPSPPPAIGGTKGNGPRTLTTEEQKQHSNKPYHVTRIVVVVPRGKGFQVYRLWTPETKLWSEFKVEGDTLIAAALKDTGLYPLAPQHQKNVDWTVTMTMLHSHLVVSEIVGNKPEDKPGKMENTKPEMTVSTPQTHPSRLPSPLMRPPGGPNIEYMKQLKIEAERFGWPLYDLTTLTQNSLGCRAGEWRGATVTEAIDLVTKFLTAWQAQQPASKPPSELDTTFPRPNGGQTIDLIEENKPVNEQMKPREAKIAAKQAKDNEIERQRARDAANAKAAKPKTATEWDTFDKTNGHKPIAGRCHDKQRAIFEIAEHLKKVYVYPGQHVRTIFACSTEEAITKLGIDKVWAEIYAYEDENPSDKPIETDAQPAPETTVETGNGAAEDVTPAAAAQTRQAGDISSTKSGTEKKEDKPVQTEPTTAEKTPLPEAPFSSNFHMVEPHGVEVQLTVRTDTVSEGLRQVEFTIEHLLKNGWMATRRDGLQSTPATNGNGASATTQTANEGLSPCIMLKVGKTFKGDKCQIVFECPDIADDVKYSSKDMGALVKITSGLRKLDGAALTASDLVNGNKIAVSGKVSWKRDGQYVNVLGTA